MNGFCHRYSLFFHTSFYHLSNASQQKHFYSVDCDLDKLTRFKTILTLFLTRNVMMLVILETMNLHIFHNIK